MGWAVPHLARSLARRVNNGRKKKLDEILDAPTDGRRRVVSYLHLRLTDKRHGGGDAAVQSIYLPKCQVDLEVEVDLAMTTMASLVKEVRVDMFLNLHFLSGCVAV